MKHIKTQQQLNISDVMNSLLKDLRTIKRLLRG